MPNTTYKICSLFNFSNDILSKLKSTGRLYFVIRFTFGLKASSLNLIVCLRNSFSEFCFCRFSHTGFFVAKVTCFLLRKNKI